MARHDVAPSPADTLSSADACGRAPSTRRRRAVLALVTGFVLASAFGLAAFGTVAAAGSAESIGVHTGDGTGSIATERTVTEETVVVSDETVSAETSQIHRVVLTDAPAGLAGFELTLTVESGDVASITDAGYADHYGMTTDPVVSADARSITVEAVDLDDEITAGATDVTLAEIEVTGVNPGETTLAVTDVHIDADGGDRIDPSLASGTVTVVDGESSDAEELNDDSSTADESADDDAVPGFTVWSALAAIAALTLVRLQ